MEAPHFIAVLVIITGVYAGDVCLHCDSVSHPEYCRLVERCQDGEACYIDKHEQLGGSHVTYSLGCRRQEVCDGNHTVYHHSQSDERKCTHCCHGDLCNAVGCNQTAYMPDRGPVCYSCHAMAHPDECRQITVCGRDEACLLSTNPSFGAVSYSAKCTMKMTCQALNGASFAVGRRDEKQVRNSLCTKCCESDLCNDGCSTVNPHPHCHPSPCAHGTCLPTTQGYTCNCHNGYTGKNCDIDIDECAYSPCHHGLCINTVGGFVCTCDHGYTGQYCNETNNDPCHPSPCVHGICYSHSDGSHRCACHKGYVGSQCDTAFTKAPCVDTLNPITCQAARTVVCKNVTLATQAGCLHTCGFCPLTVLDPCHSNPCAYGHCSSTGGNFTCTCQPGYTGVLCSQGVFSSSTSSESPVKLSTSPTSSAATTTDDSCNPGSLTATLECETYGPTRFPPMTKTTTPSTTGSSKSPVKLSTSPTSSAATKTDSCKDLTASLWCETYKNSCYDKTIAYHCPHTCRVPGCPGTTIFPPTTTTTPSITGSCADTVDNCAFMHTLQSSFCLSSIDYAKVHCRKYCRFC